MNHITHGPRPLNPRLQKLQTDIDKLTDRLRSQQQRLDAMIAQKIELENTEILELVRSLDVTPETLSDLIKTLKGDRQCKPVNPPDLDQDTSQDITHE